MQWPVRCVASASMLSKPIGMGDLLEAKVRR